MDKYVNIIGAGIAGSLVARMLRYEVGVPCRVIDDGDEHSASQASSNLFIAGWMAKFKGKGATRGMQIIEKMFGGNPDAIPAESSKIDYPFESGILASKKVKHVAQRHFLVKPDVDGMCLSVDSLGCDVRIGARVQRFEGPTVVCAGYRHEQLVPGLKVWVKVGHCYLFEGKLAPGQSRLALVSPYTHEKLYQFDENRIYYADSVATKLDVYEKRSAELKERTLTRARKLIGDLPIVEHRVGYRPFVDGFDFGYAAKVRPNVWAVNGGGKNGMVAYAQAIEQILPEIRAAYAAG